MRLRSVLVAFTALSAASYAFAGAGDLDFTFGERGRFQPPPECCGPAEAGAIAFQPDGKIVGGGFATIDGAPTASTSLPYEARGLVFRLLPNRTLDLSFGSGGLARLPNAGLRANVRSVAIRSDGHIVAAGVSYSYISGETPANAFHSFIAQVDANGRIDEGFGQWGRVAVGPLQAGSTRTMIRRSVLQPDGKLLVAGGLVRANGTPDMFVARYDAAGNLDPSFANGGVATSGFGAEVEAHDIDVRADGAIALAGTAIVGGTKYAAVLKLLANGQPDTSFDGEGFSSQFMADTRARTVMHMADGGVLVGGTQGNAAATFRLTASGALDTTYGTGGVRTYPLRNTPPSGSVVRLLPAPSGQLFALIEDSFAATVVYRLNADGVRDDTWYGYPLPGSWWENESSLGRGSELAFGGEFPYVVGAHYNQAIGVSRLDGTIYGDLSGISAGLRRATGDLTSVGVGPTGHFVILYPNLALGTTLLRITPDGRDDPVLDGNGQPFSAGTAEPKFTPAPPPPEVPVQPVRLRADGKAVVAGSKGSIYLFNPDGTQTSHAAEALVNRAQFIATYPDNRFLAGNEMRLLRYLANGTLDAAFNGGNSLFAGAERWTAAGVHPDGGLAAGLQSRTHVDLAASIPATSAAVARFDAVGAPDAAFGSNGRAPVVAGTIATLIVGVGVQSDGRVVAAGTAVDAGNARAVYAARLLANGAPDPGFGSGGVVRVPFTGDVLQAMGMSFAPDGGIYVAGMVHTDKWRGFVIRLRTDGTLDPAFAQAGIKIVDAGTRAEAVRDIGVQPDGGILLAGSSGGIPTVTRLFGSASGPGSATSALVSSYYVSILGREADAGGQAYWESERARVGTQGASASDTFYVMAIAFFGGAEYAAGNADDSQFVTDLYRTFFNRDPDPGGFDFWRDQLRGGRPRDAVLSEFLFASEFASYMTALFGSANTSRAEVSMVMDFYRGLLERLPDSGGLSHWIGRLRAAQCNGSVLAEVDAISRLFLESQEYTARQAALPTQAARNEAFVIDLYNAFMKRGAESAGLAFYKGHLDAGTMTREQVRSFFVGSAEFNQRVNAVMAQGCIQ